MPLTLKSYPPPALSHLRSYAPSETITTEPPTPELSHLRSYLSSGVIPLRSNPKELSPSGAFPFRSYFPFGPIPTSDHSPSGTIPSGSVAPLSYPPVLSGSGDIPPDLFLQRSYPPPELFPLSTYAPPELTPSVTIPFTDQTPTEIYPFVDIPMLSCVSFGTILYWAAPPPSPELSASRAIFLSEERKILYESVQIFLRCIVATEVIVKHTMILVWNDLFSFSFIRYLNDIV